MKLVFPGSFDPITIGHIEIIERAVDLADQLYIVVENNLRKKYLFTQEQRLKMVKEATADFANVQADTYDGLTVSYCKKVGAKFILRGLRSSADYLYERDIAAFNRELAQIETLFLFSGNKYAHVSSSAVRELLKYDACIQNYVPKKICGIINEIKKNKF